MRAGKTISAHLHEAASGVFPYLEHFLGLRRSGLSEALAGSVTGVLSNTFNLDNLHRAYIIHTSLSFYLVLGKPSPPELALVLTHGLL